MYLVLSFRIMRQYQKYQIIENNKTIQIMDPMNMKVVMVELQKNNIKDSNHKSKTMNIMLIETMMIMDNLLEKTMEVEEEMDMITMTIMNMKFQDLLIIVMIMSILTMIYLDL